MGKLMASFSKDQTFVGFLGESNSVKYKLNVAAISKYSILNGYVYINDKEITRNLVDGLNVFKITNNILVEQKTFTITKESDTNSANAFVSYMNNAQTDSYYIIVTGRNFVYTDAVYNWMIQNGSTCFPIKAICNSTYASAYACLYNSIKKSIVNENTLASDRMTLERSVLEVVYDELSDQGATGFPKKAIYDPNEYSISTGYEIMKYPNNTITTSLADYRINGGDVVMFTGELFTSTELSNNGMNARASIRFYQGSSLISVVNVDSPVVDKYYKYENIIDVPVNADQFAISVHRFPKNDSVNGLAKIKNLSLTECSVNTNKNKMAMFGVNGLKASNFVENGAISPEILTMYDNKDFNNLNTNNIIEEDFYISDYIIRTNIGAGHIPYEAEVDRAGDGYYFNRDNILTYAEYNESRVDWLDNRARGILVEQESTNLFLNSNDMSKVSSLATKLQKVGNLDLWSIKGSGNALIGLEGNNITIKANTKYHTQFIAKSISGKIMFGIKAVQQGTTYYTRFIGNIGDKNLSKSGVSDVTYKVTKLGNDYWLYQLVYTPTGANTMTPIISCGSASANDSVGVLIVQVEENIPTSFIVTGDTPVTRSKDVPMFNVSPLNYSYSVLYRYINQDNIDNVITEIIDYSNMVPPFVSNNFKSGWVVETSVFKRVLSNQEKNNIRESFSK